MITQDQLVGYLKDVKVGELQALITTLEDELGVKASVPQVFVPQGENRGNPEAEQTEFTVVLMGYSDEVPKAKMAVIKAVREVTGLGLKEAKAAVDDAPTSIREDITKAEATELAAKLTEKGGIVEVR
jgi:large subunit ribosomal protein L7/L12